MQIEKKVFSKLFKETHGVKLSLISDLEQATVDAANAREKYNDVANDWVVKYIDLQDEVASLNNFRQTYLESIEELRDKMDIIRTQIEAFGFDPRTIVEFENAMLADGIFNANLDDDIDTINIINNITRL